MSTRWNTFQAAKAEAKLDGRALFLAVPQSANGRKKRQQPKGVKLHSPDSSLPTSNLTCASEQRQIDLRRFASSAMDVGGVRTPLAPSTETGKFF
eukprot:5688988-Amphidinium_carterae.1